MATHNTGQPGYTTYIVEEQQMMNDVDAALGVDAHSLGSTSAASSLVSGQVINLTTATSSGGGLGVHCNLFRYQYWGHGTRYQYYGGMVPGTSTGGMVPGTSTGGMVPGGVGGGGSVTEVSLHAHHGHRVVVVVNSSGTPVGTAVLDSSGRMVAINTDGRTLFLRPRPSATPATLLPLLLNQV
ncbi:hypothetical protein FHG87_023319 [Trinorchestia longiramus]|nr:hypothetical protein FHG87_023319 [Trinorchestia longiramus]